MCDSPLKAFDLAQRSCGGAHFLFEQIHGADAGSGPLARFRTGLSRTIPTRGIEKFKEGRRERFLTGEELERLGSAIREAETSGVPWAVDESKPTAKHVPKAKRSTRIAPSAAAALRLLLFTGCRLREILHLRWEQVDFERGCLFLPDSKSGRRTIILNAPALSVLNGLERVGPYVVAGNVPDEPRRDLKRSGALG